MNVLVFCALLVSLTVVLPMVEGICDTVPIEEWAGTSSGHVRELPRPVDLVVVTHTVTTECNTDQSCEAIVKGIRYFHKEQGMDDIGLSFLVGGNGKIYEGAGWRVGHHTVGYNEKSISMSFIGDFRETIPTEAALNAAQQIMSCFVLNQYLDPNYMLVGHRQLVFTVSPGDALQNLIQTWPQWSHYMQTRPHLA